MAAREDGDHTEAFEQRLDALLARLCPGWEPPGLPEGLDPKVLSHHRVNAKRSQVSTSLRENPDGAFAAAAEVLDAIVHDEDPSFNRLLIEPMLATVGRRAVQEHLIRVIETGPSRPQVCAVRAWYWSQPVAVFESTEALRARCPTAASEAEIAEVADLRERYRAACLTAFVACRDAATQDCLARGFVLGESFYALSLHGAVTAARVIAEADPARFKDLLTRATDATNLVALHVGDR